MKIILRGWSRSLLFWKGEDCFPLLPTSHQAMSEPSPALGTVGQPSPQPGSWTAVFESLIQFVLESSSAKAADAPAGLPAPPALSRTWRWWDLVNKTCRKLQGLWRASAPSCLNSCWSGCDLTGQKITLWAWLVVAKTVSCALSGFYFKLSFWPTQHSHRIQDWDS